MSKFEIVNTKKWLDENSSSFYPPVCNKLMHNGQLVVMFVGGPNIREDYHIEEGEELFYQLKGQMSVKIIENGQHKEIFVNEGECFILPARIPHSPQRPENTIGLVIERRRDNNEIDGVRWHVPQSTQVLYEKWFKCFDLGVQLAPLIREYFASDEFMDKQARNNVLNEYPFELNQVKIDKLKHGPFNLIERINSTNANVKLSPEGLQFNIQVLKEGQFDLDLNEDLDYWLWQLKGKSIIDENYELNEKDSILIKENSLNSSLVGKISQQGLLMIISQNPNLK